MELALAAAQLVAPDGSAKRDAIARLGAAGSVDARAVLIEARAANPDLVTAIDVSIATIEKQLQIRRIAETLFQGLSLGSVLLLAALGLAVTFGVMGVINMAHGEFVMLGAYATFMVQELCRGIPWLAPWALPLAVPAAFLVTARGRRAAGARADPASLRPAARDAADDLRRRHDPAAGGARRLRRAEPAR